MSRARGIVGALGLAPHVKIVRERKEREHDEQIICAVVALANDRDRKLSESQIRVKRGGFITAGLAGIPYAACAVGAGLLYRGVDDGEGEALEKFAALYDVSKNFAIGVSDGFEGDTSATIGWDPREDESLFDDPNVERDYERGWAVGSAIRTAVRA